MHFEDAQGFKLALKLTVCAVVLATLIVLLSVGVAHMFTQEITQNKTFPTNNCVTGTVLQADGSCTPQE